MIDTTRKLGLALSGGGFRATLYHLGLVRFLRDAGILPQVSHITSVSGGSILAAHLVLNWDRYNGSPSEFEAAAAEVLAFVRLDVRNRITRRFPLAMPLRAARRLLGRSNRILTLTGLLEYHYREYLYGDTSLFQLPERPQLHILATNLSEGCLCSFHRGGLLMVRRTPQHAFRVDRVEMGLATVPMAVTASSAFPGFFPPLELTGADVGANAGEFGRQAYTDGGVFDNLGVRMFRCLERQLLAESPLAADDFTDLPAVALALRDAGTSGTESPQRRLAQLLAAYCRVGPPHATNVTAVKPEQMPVAATWRNESEEALLAGLWDVMRHCRLQDDPVFAAVKMSDPDVETLRAHSGLGGRPLEAADQFWLNRHLVEATVSAATGRRCLRRLDSLLDGVLVSDVGKRIEVQADRRAGGLLRTAMRATDILMDRVWQLETETFHDAPGFVFAPITDVVDPAVDSTALHVEIQRQTANIRTDLDRFSPLEISSLIRHGYAIGRQACRTRPDLFGTDLPATPPWDPVPAPPVAAPPVTGVSGPARPARAPIAATREARQLQASAHRRIWTSLFDYRDWTSHVYVPLLVPIFILMPYFIVQYYERSRRVSEIVEALAQGSRDLEQMSRLLEYGPPPRLKGEAAEEVSKLDEPDFAGITVVQDSFILDLRRWSTDQAGHSDPNSHIYHYRRLKVAKKMESTGNQVLHWRLLTRDPGADIKFPRQQLQPRLRQRIEMVSPGDRRGDWELSYDLGKVPAGDFVNLLVEYYASGSFLQHSDNRTAVPFTIAADTAELTMWVLMPARKAYGMFRITRSPVGAPDQVEAAPVVTEYLASDSSILAFKLLSLKAGWNYEVSWTYK